MVTFKQVLIGSFPFKGRHVKFLLGFLKIKPGKLLTRIIYPGIPASAVFITHTILKLKDHRVIVGGIINISFLGKKYITGCVICFMIIDHQVVKDFLIFARS